MYVSYDRALTKQVVLFCSHLHRNDSMSKITSSGQYQIVQVCSAALMVLLSGIPGVDETTIIS